MSDQERYRLADSSAVEPLINSWVAWGDLVSPAPYSMHLLNYQMRILSSYVSGPELHAEASRSPKFLGGPYIDIAPERADEVRQLLVRTEKTQGANIEFAKAIMKFYDYLSREAQGQSLESFYEQKPAALDGYVELIYDYYSHPIMRVFESLLYESPYYNKNLQSLRISRQTSDDARRFFLNTPRLQEPGQIDWAVPFESPVLDDFYKLNEVAAPLGRIREILNLQADDDQRLLPLLTQEAAPAPAERWTESKVRVRYFGHACVLVEWGGISILTDPWIGVMSEKRDVERLSYHDLPEKIDYVLITHGINAP